MLKLLEIGQIDFDLRDVPHRTQVQQLRVCRLEKIGKCLNLYINLYIKLYIKIRYQFTKLDFQLRSRGYEIPVSLHFN